MRERFGSLGQRITWAASPPAASARCAPWHEHCRVKTQLLSRPAKVAPRPDPASVKASDEAAAAPYLKKER